MIYTCYSDPLIPAHRFGRENIPIHVEPQKADELSLRCAIVKVKT